MGITALVVGAGGFGKHHARILAQLNGKYSDLPTIDRVVVTRTDADKSAETSCELQQKAAKGTEVVGAKVTDEATLEVALRTFQPEYIVIAARDKIQGENIHPPYVFRALEYGKVLCEKPFCSGQGERNAEYIERLQRVDSHQFGLELPFAVVGREMRAHDALATRMRNAKQIKFYWRSAKKRDYCFDDLALHPWSLLSEDYEFSMHCVHKGKTTGSIDLSLFQLNGHYTKCSIQLAYGTDFRAMSFDDYTIVVRTEGEHNTLIHVDGQLEDALRDGKREGERILMVDNPVEQNIVALLQGKPVMGIQRTYASQEFLEKIHRRARL